MVCLLTCQGFNEYAKDWGGVVVVVDLVSPRGTSGGRGPNLHSILPPFLVSKYVVHASGSFSTFLFLLYIHSSQLPNTPLPPYCTHAQVKALPLQRSVSSPFMQWTACIKIHIWSGHTLKFLKQLEKQVSAACPPSERPASRGSTTPQEVFVHPAELQFSTLGRSPDPRSGSQAPLSVRPSHPGRHSWPGERRHVNASSYIASGTNMVGR